MFSLSPYEPKLNQPPFPLKDVSELRFALHAARNEYERKVQKIFEQFLDAEKLKEDHDILIAIEQFAATHCPINSPVKNIKVVEELSKRPLDGGLYIIGGVLETNNEGLGRIFQPGLYHAVDTSWFYGSSGRVEENQITKTETLTKILDDTGAREIFKAVIKGILAE